MTRAQLFIYCALLAGALALGLGALTKPPVHDGAWLLAVLMALTAVVLAATAKWFTEQSKRSTKKDTE